MCVNVYADLISNMTIYLMQNTAAGDVRVQNELAKKLDISPNKLMTRKTFITNLVRVLLLYADGNQVTYPRYTADGLLDNLEPLKASSVSFMDVPGGYVIYSGGKTYQPDEVLHFVVNPDPERPWIGTGFRVALKDAMKGLKQAGATKQKLLESPAPSIIVKVDGLTEEFSSADGRKKLRGEYIDSNENGEPWFIPSEAFEVTTVKPLTMKDLALADNMTIDKRVVAGIFGVPPFLIGVGNFDKEEFNTFISTRVLSIAKVIEQTLTRGLLYAPDLYWRFNPRSLYSWSIADISDVAGAMVQQVAMSRNEWREWIGMEPRADMEELIVLENFVPAAKLGDQKKLNQTGGDSSAK